MTGRSDTRRFGWRFFVDMPSAMLDFALTWTSMTKVLGHEGANRIDSAIQRDRGDQSLNGICQ